jgi:selenocysteine-specific elongation factor
MIVATSGHVDHGKSSLVFALTGQPTDRLPEEQRRGMTIEPGYAHADLGDGAVADFVDLPGHERYLRHLLAGIAAADVALLVVAVDDGPMPQTHEHLALLHALRIARVLPVLSKIDRADAPRATEVRAQVQRLLHAQGFAATPAFEVCAPRGEGLEALRRHLRALHGALPPRDSSGAFRLAVDRLFVRSGVGAVAAGTVLSGQVEVGDELVAMPSGGALRVRGLQVHGQAVTHARAGQRCALNVAPRAGERAPLERGDWLVAPPLAAPTRRLDVRWSPARAPTALPGAPSAPEAQGVRDTRIEADAPAHAAMARAALQLHLGNAVRQVHLVPLGPGPTELAQLLLDQPVSALHGDRFVLRDPASRRLLGGGAVLDAAPPARGRAQPQRLAELQALAAGSPARALAGLLACRLEGVEAGAFALNWNLSSSAVEALAVEAGAVRVPHPDGMRLVGAAAWQTLLDEISHRLAQAHREEPASRGLADDALFRALPPSRQRAPARSAVPPLLRAALDHLRRAGAIERDGFVWRLPGHEARLAEAEAALLKRVVAVMEPHGLRPPPLGELAALIDLPLPEASAFLQRAAALGHLVQIAKNRFFLPATLQALVDVARATAAAAPDGRFEVIPFRDRSGIGRNLSIQVLEYFDRVRITRFVRERRSMVGPET